MKWPRFYFDWLQARNPTGTVDRYPELRNAYETSVPGIYCCGDLTGIPLIKLAAESGHDLIDRIHADDSFQRERAADTQLEHLDILIIGAGPAGVAAAIRAHEQGLSAEIIESSNAFNTIINFPKGKPIYVTPEQPPMQSSLQFTDGSKETLLEQLRDAVAKHPVTIHDKETVTEIRRDGGHFVVVTTEQPRRARRVILAIGKSGNPRRLDVPGEDLPKVFTRLIDPGEHQDQDILVVGGGDSAVEAAVALAGTGNRVTLSYRKPALSRPKELNRVAFDKAVRDGRITPIFESTVNEVREGEIVLNTKTGEQTIANDAVYALIGTQLPYEFFRWSGVRMEGEKNVTDYVKCAALILFASVLYFGKKSPVTPVSGFGDFLRLPTMLGSDWATFLKGSLAWLSFMGMIASGAYLLVHILRHPRTYFSDRWTSFKHLYYIAMFLLFGSIYCAYNLQGYKLLGQGPGTWYTAMYSLTIVVFGLRRMVVRPTPYIIRQTSALMAFQVIPLCILPVIVLPWLGSHGLLGDWVMTNVFPGESYWRAYGLILAWPLFMFNLASNEPIAFWLVVSLVQTFVIIPLIVYKWGKGAYCGWVCSCGALAETLGDEYRTRAPHGPVAKKLDNAGQYVLWFATAVTLAVLCRTWLGVSIPGTSEAFKTYEFVVDIVFAGVLGVGVYFFLSGRVWCRFLCPLAALMHIYARFSPYRIMSNKKRCISCNICTKVCHMGIDVMGFANRGIPMDDVECVRCSACVANCPMQVLTFGDIGRTDTANTRYKNRHLPLTPGWPSGLPLKDINMLLEEEREAATRHE